LRSYSTIQTVEATIRNCSQRKHKTLVSKPADITQQY